MKYSIRVIYPDDTKDLMKQVSDDIYDVGGAQDDYFFLEGLPPHYARIQIGDDRVTFKIGNKPERWALNEEKEIGDYRLKLVERTEAEDNSFTEDAPLPTESEDKRSSWNSFKIGLEWKNTHSGARKSVSITVPDTSIGSGLRNRIVLDDTRRVSEFHAVLHLRGQGALLENRSEQGTIILQRQSYQILLSDVSQFQLLLDGDRFVIGPYVFTPTGLIPQDD